ncbi:hypothetical protein Leryth_022083 [Lithospermum erythrorhizon]|nr:hypothetical protein Leryth_022083 [Lithospermum erythrorhizon]
MGRPSPVHKNLGARTRATLPSGEDRYERAEGLTIPSRFELDWVITEYLSIDYHIQNHKTQTKPTLLSPRRSRTIELRTNDKESKESRWDH